MFSVLITNLDVLGVLGIIKLRQGCVQHPVIYMQVKGVNAKTVVTNLRKHSRPGAIKTGYIEKKEICTWDDRDDWGDWDDRYDIWDEMG